MNSLDFVDTKLLEGMYMETSYETRNVGDETIRGKQLYKLM